MSRSPAPLAYLPTTILFILSGWGGLIVLTNASLPTLGPRWLFFFLVMVAVTGTALPAAAFLNHRFPSKPPAKAAVVLRQALWFGIYADTLIWLQYGRVYNNSLAVIFFIGFFAIEFFLRIWERSQWRSS